MSYRTVAKPVAAVRKLIVTEVCLMCTVHGMGTGGAPPPATIPVLSTSGVNQLWAVEGFMCFQSHNIIRCNTLQYTAIHCNTLKYTEIHCNTLQYTTIHCNTLQYTAIHCNTLQYTTKY